MGVRINIAMHLEGVVLAALYPEGIGKRGALGLGGETGTYKGRKGKIKRVAEA